MPTMRILAFTLLASTAWFAAPAAAQTMRERWDALPPAEQRRVLESYDRWKKLGSDEKSLMKLRFDKLETERERAKESLDEDDRGKLDRMREPDRREELTQRAKKTLRDRFDRLPPDLRDRIEKDFRKLPPPERAERVKQSVKQHVEREVKERLGRKVESGKLSREAVDDLRRKSADQQSNPRERLELLRKLLIDHPDAFDLTPEQLDRLKKTSDAGFALHLLDRLRHRGPPPPDRDRLRDEVQRRRDDLPRKGEDSPRKRDDAPRDGPRPPKAPKGEQPRRGI